MAPMALVGLSLPFSKLTFIAGHAEGKRIGIIGLDTSHSVAFTKSLNASIQNPMYDGFRIVAAYPQGSKDIVSSTERIPGYTEDVKKLGVEIVGSIQELSPRALPHPSYISPRTDEPMIVAIETEEEG